MSEPTRPGSGGARRGEAEGGADATGSWRSVRSEAAGARPVAAVDDGVFRAVVEALPDGVAVVRRGRVVFANRALRRFLGGAGLVGRLAEELVHPDDRGAVAPWLGDPDDGPIEARCVRLDGATVSAELSALAVPGVAGATAVVVRDATRQRRFEAQMLASDRLASMGTLAASVGHEINNPLAFVISNLEFARRALDGDAGEAGRAAPGGAALGEALREAHDGALRVKDIVRDLKAFARADDGLRVGVDVRRVLDASLHLAWNEIRQRARLVKEYEDVGPVDANESRLGQVFLNLLVNATQALPEGAPGANEVAVRVARGAAGAVVVEVRDTGHGIPPEVRGRIFTPFFTTKPVGVGTGLGLTVCRDIVASLGGRIEVESAHGRGTIFRVVLPPGRAPAPASVAPAAPPSARGRFLIVDDEAAVGTAMRRLLAGAHDVEVAESGADALARLDAGARYDVIFCDLMMPEVTGMDLHAALAGTCPAQAARVVFMSGGAFTPEARAFLQRVPNPRLDKPFSYETLMRLVAERMAAREA